MDWFEYLNVSGPAASSWQGNLLAQKGVHHIFLINFFLVHQTWPVNKGIEPTIECVL